MYFILVTQPSGHLVAQNHRGHLVAHRNTRTRREIKTSIWCVIVNFEQISNLVALLTLNRWISTEGSCYWDIMFRYLLREFVFYLTFYWTLLFRYQFLSFLLFRNYSVNTWLRRAHCKICLSKRFQNLSKSPQGFYFVILAATLVWNLFQMNFRCL